MMILPRITPPARATLSYAAGRQGIYGFDLDFLLPFQTLRPWAPPIQQIIAVRWATHKASRPANRGKDGPGKRLGAKKTDGECVKIGMIIYRQRGTKWFPGENAGMGRDHTIFALQPGYVRYYRDPSQPKRKFIGIALRPHHNLPTPPLATTRRWLGRVPVPLVELKRRDTVDQEEVKVLKSGIYYHRPPNWKLGLFGEEVKNPYDRSNTWGRWQKRLKRINFAKSRGGGKQLKSKSKSKSKGAKQKKRG